MTARCDTYAVDEGLVIDCVLPSGHAGSHDPGDIDWTKAPHRPKQTPPVAAGSLPIPARYPSDPDADSGPQKGAQR